MEFSDSLDHRLKQLGFDTLKDIYKEATPLTNYPDEKNPLAEAQILDDLYSDPENIGYIFIIAKDLKIDDWYIHSINASVQLETKRNKEGIIVISTSHEASQKSLPHKNNIRKEILERVAIEKNKELAHSIQQYKHQINMKRGI
ncbi:MAG: hypothetical protein J0I32_09780 [Sphingobacteriales bacterium]|nr:hypothetical protein [Sphingobacteriales bacterium]OJW00285.1 MAG: hypothetical protein BGO52_04155 [Sphingobacteriales bacterium 44-61]